MKYARYIAALVLLVCATGCYEVDDEITINENGTGVYVTEIDMGQMLKLMQSVAGEDELSQEGLDKAIDTTFQLKDVLDAHVTPAQKALLSPGSMHLQMDIPSKAFVVEMKFPFSSYDNLQQLIGGPSNTLSVMTDVFKKYFKNDGKTDSAQAVNEGPDPQLPDLNSVFDVTVTNGLISKKVNAEKLKALKAKQEVMQLQQMAAAGIEIPYTTRIRLPRPLKKTDNSTLVKVSDDKRSVTIQYNMLEVLESPDKFSFTLEY